MTLSQAAKAPPVFLTKNRVDSDQAAAGAITVSTGDSLKARAYDMAPGSWWQSEGSSDAIAEWFQVWFAEGDPPIPTAVSADTIILRGLNLKAFVVTITPSVGADVVYTVTGATADYYVIHLSAAIDIARIRIDMTTTQTANAEKTIGDIFVGTMIYQPTKGMTNYKSTHPDNVKTVVLADGTLDETLVLHADGSFTLFRASVGFRGLSLSEVETFEAHKNDTANRIFLFWPEPGDVPDEFYQGRIAPGSFDAEYLSLEKTAGYSLDFEFEEMGAQ